MATITAYPRNDIRSMLKPSCESKCNVVPPPVPCDSTKKKEKKQQPEEKKSEAEEKKSDIDSLLDAYLKIYKVNKEHITTRIIEIIKKLLKTIIEGYKLRPKKLYRYFHYLKYNPDEIPSSTLVKSSIRVTSSVFETLPETLEYILDNPFTLISFHNQFISYKDAMKICVDRGIVPELHTRIMAWVYDYFIGKQNKYYITEYDYHNKLLTDFSSEFINEKERTQANHILLGIMTDVKFGQKKYYTTNEFIEHEKNIGDMVIDLFYNFDDDKNDDDDEDDQEINEHIKDYIIKYKTKDKPNSKHVEESTVSTTITTYENSHGAAHLSCPNHNSFKFEPEQLEAIHKGCKLKRGQLINITGPPGTGKSTIVNCIINYKLERNAHIAVMAPTGLAQKSLKKSCKYRSVHDVNKKIIFSTLHRAINFTFVQDVIYKKKKDKDIHYMKEEDPPFKPDILIVDEASMIDLNLFLQLLKACKKFDASLILIGDIHQLPPIGPGIPFESIIKSDLFDTIRLTSIKRQENGNLKEVIHKLNTPNGIALSDFDGSRSIFMEAKTAEEIEEAVIKIYRDEMLQDKDINIHTMCAQKDKGVFHLNPVIQKLKNGHSEKLFVKKYENCHEHEFYEGDLVMRTENDYKDDTNIRVNGDVGTIHQTEIKKYGKNYSEYRYTIRYDDGEETNLSVDEIRDAFVPFYASTVHKMQGLQKSVIIFIVSRDHQFCLTNENSKKLVYTAISRCSTTFYIVGDKNLFIRSQQSKEMNNYPTRFMKEFNRYDFGI